jgi:hypothetical protein
MVGGVLVLSSTAGACTAASSRDAAPTVTTSATHDTACPSQRAFEDVLNTSIEMLEGMTSVEVVGTVVCSGGWAVAPTQVHFANNQVAPRIYVYILRRTSETWELSDAYLPSSCAQLPADLASVACAGST